MIILRRLTIAAPGYVEWHFPAPVLTGRQSTSIQQDQTSHGIFDFCRIVKWGLAARVNCVNVGAEGQERFECGDVSVPSRDMKKCHSVSFRKHLAFVELNDLLNNVRATYLVKFTPQSIQPLCV
jgi:hypothetical protein